MDQISTEHSCAKSIAAELYNVAKANNALDAVGGSTSWRWQEGLISRMPKASTVAAVLTKSFGTEDFNVWFEKAPNSLKPFIENTFQIKSGRELVKIDSIKDIYDSLVISMLTCGEGTSRDDLILNLCLVKYSKNLDQEDSYSEPSESVLLNLYSDWAKAKLDNILKKISYKKDYDLLSISKKRVNITSEIHSNNMLELSRLRLSVVGYTSESDMIRSNWYELTDEQHFDIERKMLSLQNDIDKYIRQNYNNNCTNEALKKRIYNYTAITLASVEKGGM